MLLIALLVFCVIYAVVMFSVQGALKRRHQKQYDQIMSSLEEQNSETARAEQSVLPADDVKKRLQQIKEHLDSGLITKEEYKARRQELLKEL